MLKLIVFGVLCLLNGYCCTSSESESGKDWWQGTVLYQIYPRSFKDSDGDGIGDLRGIISKLDYLKDTGIGATWLSPIFQSPMKDFGYDIANFTDIHDEYGTMADFEALLAKAKSLGIKIILDYVPNHSSDQCEWFLKSIDREPGYEDFYIWNDGVLDDDGIKQPPNNWQSVFYGSAWTWNGKRQQFYLHQFAAGQPDLNYRNPRVVEAMDNVMRFWLDKGVDGFRIDAVNHLYEVEDLRDEPISGETEDKDSYQFTHHYYTKDLPESYEMVYHWRQLLDDYIATHGGDTRIMLTEAYANISFTMDFYESEEGQKGSHVPFNFLLITDVNAESDARDFVFNIQKWLTYMPRGATANWVLGNHDQPRVGSRYGVERIDAMNMLLMTLPGIAITYNGEEIGMVDYRNISWEDTKDPAAKNTNPDIYEKFSRDPERTPFQWDSSENAGFTEGSSTWIPVHPNYVSLNLASEQEKSRSHYKLYRRLANLRKHPTLQSGSFYPLAINRNILAYKRELQGYDTFVVVINMASKEQTVNLLALGKLPETMIVVAAGSESNYREGNLAVTSHLVLTAFDSVVLKGFTHEVPQRIQDGENRIETILSIGALTLLGLLMLRALNNRFPVPSYTKFI